MFDIEFLRRASNAAVSEYLAGLAKMYTPEWRVDFSQPDAGTVLTKLFSHMLVGNMLRAGRLPDKISAQLVDMLGLQPLPARPSQSAVRFSAVGADRVFLPRGSKLSAKSADGEGLTFETLHSLTVVSAEISRVIFSRESLGKIFYADSRNSISLYGKAQGTFPEAVLTLEHPYLFMLGKNSGLRISFDGMAPENLAALADPHAFRWSLMDETGAEYGVAAEPDAGENCLRLTAETGETAEQGAYVSLHCRALKPVMEPISAAGIYIDADAGDVEPEQIQRDDVLQENERFYPFGERLSLLSELKIACDEVLTKKGSDVTVRFNLRYENFKNDVPEENNRQYKLIMKVDEPVSPPLNVCAQEVSLEYWNGNGWKQLKTTPSVKRVFASEQEGEMEIGFICPEDIAPTQTGAAEHNWLRLRLMRADGCYLSNTVHHVPVVSDLRFSYKYRQRTQRPAKARVLREMREADLAAGLKDGKYTELFSRISPDGDQLMLGFDSKPAGEAVNIYFDMEKTREPIWIEAEYSGASGFRKLHLDDYTDGFSHSDAIVFSSPQDFSAVEIYGESMYWVVLRLYPQDESHEEIIIRGIYPNTVRVEGKRTLDAEYFYTDELITESELKLSSDDLLYTDVWFDENPVLDADEKAKLKEEIPENILEERDSGGDLIHFWVRWNEVRDFAVCKPDERCYRLDRSFGTVRFSDGVHGRRPPTEEICTVKIVPVSSSGARGNVPENSINQPLEQLDFIGTIENITPACGGHDSQKFGDLLRHACSYIRSGNRVVTAEDMLDAVKHNCGEIAKLKLLCDGGIITLLFLPYDYENAQRLFSQTEEHIRAILSKHWQEPRQNLRILLPDFAEVIVEAGVVSNGDALNEEEAVRRRLNDFLHPITGGFGRAGWEIGVLPQREQLLSVIQSVLPKVKVEQLRASVRNRTNGQYSNPHDAEGAQSMAAIPGKYNLTWRRKAGI